MAPASMTMKKSLIYHHLQPWLGHSVLIRNGQVWFRKRRLLTPAFHFDILKSYITIFNSSSKIMHVFLVYPYRRLNKGSLFCYILQLLVFICFWVLFPYTSAHPAVTA
uniref:leukotriene-B(4) omega-hydroxylase 2 n=1 Tax=Maylandia zebra TaxID=106582 RepID=UPI000D31B78E|nr:leukotriene-B(4) omega-hydroxylase 2 [Maylandia zebra]